jgi:hypothetical protein
MEANWCRNNKVRCATLDTNVLMCIFLEKIDVFTQLRELGFKKFIIPLRIVDELKNLEKFLKGKERLAARFALNLILECNDCEIVEVKAAGVDASLLATAEKYGCTLLTNDKDLKRRAKAKGVEIGYLREMRRVEGNFWK